MDENNDSKFILQPTRNKKYLLFTYFFKPKNFMNSSETETF